MKTESQSIDQASKAPQPPWLVKPVRITEQVWPEGTVPVVSVFNWAYNHARFICESIESILMQETTFPVEIIIHDDASTDGTTEIIREYEHRYPQIFCNIIQRENQWSQGKSVMRPLFSAPRGEFVALAHGDDYWTEPFKLQRQVDLLEEKSDLSAVCHWVFDEVEDGQLVAPEAESQRDWPFETITVEQLIKRNVVTTCSVMFRRASLPDETEIIESCPMGDYPLWIFLGVSGPFGCIQERMGVYRMHGGVWTTQQNLAKAAQEAYVRTIVKPALPERLHGQVYESFSRRVRVGLHFANLGSVPQTFEGYLRLSRQELCHAGLPMGLTEDFDRILEGILLEFAAELTSDRANKAWESGCFADARSLYAQLAFGRFRSVTALVKCAAACAGPVGLWFKRAVARSQPALSTKHY